MAEELTAMRLDKWLKISRFFKKRADAVEAVENGSVKINGERVKPAKMIKTGDLLTVRNGSQYRDYTIRSISMKTVSATLAREMYSWEKPEGWTPEAEEMMKLLEVQERENRKNNRGKMNKKQRRIVNKHKYGE